MKKLALLLTLTNVLAACSASSPSLTPNAIHHPPPIQRTAVEQTADGASVEIKRNVDILFVVDDSDSMRAHAVKLSENIKKFVDEIAKNKTIDFHIAYTTVYDRNLVQVCPAGTDRAGQSNYENPGTLGPLRGPTLPDGRRFVTRDDDFGGILASTLGATDLVKPYVEARPWHPEICPSGPEDEESLFPITEALENRSLLNGPNKGFRRQDAKFVAIILSDAKDAAIATGKTNLETVYRKIMLATGSTDERKNARVFAVVIKPGSVQNGSYVSLDNETCKVDPAFANKSEKIRVGDKYVTGNKWPSMKTLTMLDNPLARLAEMTQDEGPGALEQTLSICDRDYGTALAKFGTRIQQDAIEDVTVPLKNAPQLFANGATNGSPLTVYLGDEVLPKGKWQLQQIDGVSTVVIPAKAIDWTSIPRGTKVRVSYVPVDPSLPTSRSY